MALEIWPRSLPYDPRTDNFQGTRGAMAEITPFQFGNTRQRNTRSLSKKAIQMGLLFWTEEYERFDEFWEKNLDCGTKRFQMPVWTGFKALSRWTGNPFVDCEVQIDGTEYGYVRYGPRWRVTFPLKVIRVLKP